MYLPDVSHALIQLPIASRDKKARQRSRRGSGRYSAEPLERRLLLAAVPVTLNIYRLLQLSNPDSDNPIGADGDYYAQIKIGDNPVRSTENFVDNPIEGSDFNPHWFLTEFIEPADGLVPVEIKMFDSDVGDDNVVDINSGSGTTLNFSFDPISAHLSGQATGNGDGDGDAQITFEMYLSREIEFTITQLDELDDPDDDDFTEGDGGDYAFGVRFGDYPEFYTDNFLSSAGQVNLSYKAFVNPADVVVPIVVRVVDYDDFSGNDTMDVNPDDGHSELRLYYNPTTQQWDEQTGNFTFPVNQSQGNAGDRARIWFNIKTIGGDTDGDGLPDDWEINGLDVNGDGTIDLVLNSNPLHKDVFVEVDAMQGLAPFSTVMPMVVGAFAAVPNSLLNNPDGLPGITLRVLVDETNIPVRTFPNTWTDFDAIKTNLNANVAGGFGTVADRANANAANILAAKRAVYRYAMFADQYGAATNSSSGLAEIDGNDFMITMGRLWQNVTANMQAGTFMHEMGHTLGLLHGGSLANSEFNFKPNYHSIMNYTWQLPFQPGVSPTANETAYANSWTLDYSRVDLPTLDENQLDESVGIGGTVGSVVQIGPVRNSSGGILDEGYVNESGPVDWNGDGDTTDIIARDINFLGDSNGDGSTNASDRTPGQLLSGFNDWANILYNFRESEGYQDGVHTEVETNELTFTEYTEVNDLLIYTSPSGNGADNLTLRRNGATLEIYDAVAGVVVASRALADTRLVQIIGADGENDTLTIDFAVGGFFAVAGGIEFRGGTGGNDRLKIIGTGATTGRYTPSAATPGDGLATIALGAQSSLVSFAGLEPVEVSGMASYSLVTPNSADIVTVNPGLGSGNQPAHIITGTSGGIGFESLTLFKVDDFTLDTGANDGTGPADSVSIALGSASTGLDQLHVFTGAGADTVSLSAAKRVRISVDGGADGGDTLVFNGESLDFLFTGNSFSTLIRKPMTYAGIETITLSNGDFGTFGTIAPSIIVNSAAKLSGIGTILGTVSANSGGTVAPGVLGLGSLRSGSVSFVPGADFDIWLNGLTPGFGHSQLRVTGTVNLGGATLDARLGLLRPIPGDELVLIRNDGSDPVVGKFAQGDLVTVGGKKFVIDYAFDGDGDGQLNDVALIAFGAALGPDPCNPCDTALYVSGTTGNDTIRFLSASGGKVKVLINGQDQGTFKPSGRLIAFGQSGNDTITVELPSREAWLYGQGGDDTLITGNNDSILIGGIGKDRLVGGNGKDLLIGGAGADTLEAGNGDDLLIAGATVYDAKSDANMCDLCAIQDEWLHGSGGYAGRIGHLKTGGGRSRIPPLNSTTIFSDTEVDRLTGGTGLDWFLVGTGDLITDKAANETATLI